MAKIELNKKTSELNITVSANSEKWAKEQKEAEKHLLSNVSVKGFRKGQAPVEIAKKQISKEEVMMHALRHMLDEMSHEAGDQIADDVMVLDAPTYKVEAVDEKKLEVTFIYPVYPEIKLGDYKNHGVKFEVTKVEDHVVEEEVAKLLSSKTMMIDKDGNLEKGDVAVFDFEGFVAGKAFEGGKATEYELEIGSGQFIPGFEEQMIGLSKGEAKDINVKFPDEYHSDELKGKDAVFKIKLHDIKVKEVPTLTDEFVAEMGIPKVKTAQELRDYIKSVFTQQEEQSARAKFMRDAFDKIMETSEFVVPAALIVKEMQQVEKQLAEHLKQQGITIAQYMGMIGADRVKLDSQFRVQAESRLNDALLFAEISKLEKIELTDADYEAEYVKLAKVYNQSEDAIRGMITKHQMQIPMTNDRVIDLLIKYSK